MKEVFFKSLGYYIFEASKIKVLESAETDKKGTAGDTVAVNEHCIDESTTSTSVRILIILFDIYLTSN